MTASTPDHTAIFAAASLDAIPPLPTGAARSTGHALELVVDLDHLLDQRAPGGESGIPGEQAGRVGEQDQQVGTDQVGHQRGQPVVVPEPDLLVGHGVVLVDHGDHPQLQQAGQRLTGVQVLAAVDEVQRRQQHLAGHEAVAGEGVAPDPHEAVLAHRRHRLQRGRVRRAGPSGGQPRPPGRDGARGHHDHPAPVRTQAGHLVGQFGDGVRVHAARTGGHRRGADLHDDGAAGGSGVGAAHERRRRPPGSPVNSGWSRYHTNDRSPMVTRSPSWAPARASARSTPMRRNRPWT